MVTTDKNNLKDLALGLDLPNGAIHWASSGDEALEIINQKTFDLVISDEKLADMTGLALVEKLVKINPMINCAAVSSLSKSEYHEASEGLGILMQLPAQPSQSDGQALMAYLKKVLGFTAATGD
ncbi:response regulator transcription factor [Desulfosarcina variabilis]|uniref:response regulator transcription factor n=1 Tax=Desulfosarcina variabilis TaxID=2300 RepID=UPI003AFA0764